MKRNIFMILLLSLFFASCSSLTKTEQESRREKLNKMSNETITKLIKIHPEIEEDLGEAVGYAVANIKLTKIPMFGVGAGNGVLVDLESNNPTYYKIKRVDFGAGWGVRSYKLLIIINDKEILEDYKNGKWIFEFGTEASLGTVAADGSSSGLKKKIETYILADGGVSATITARIIRAKLDEKLNEEISN